MKPERICGNDGNAVQIAVLKYEGKVVCAIRTSQFEMNSAAHFGSAELRQLAAICLVKADDLDKGAAK